MKKLYMVLAVLGIGFAAAPAQAGNLHISLNSYTPAPRVYYPPAYAYYPPTYYAPPVTVVRYARPVRAREYYVSRGYKHRRHHHW